ncbi:ABC transporter ATP-binding protein [Janthinobacterium sp. B9-8]|uniref:ABC transporter ATP-binding protein n=1 Tax=Janthinobacterium sp. B9-8 TaxID=1236179 RepID=UPI00061CE6CD|nr:ABC transporter ATP-binding protein [Janthinobacterium sp. B9-8]AMC35821.1 ABC transporter [Janthinobacterium sp. B9-8]
MIQISGLTFDYPGHRALNQLNLSVERGSVTALVGANGAGKTTLMRCIAGLETPLSGSIAVAGLDVQEEPRAVHRQMGYLSDFFGLYQDLTVAQCLEYAAASQGLAKEAIAAAISSTAQRLSLQDRLGQKASSLSRGLRQRVAIGQAIIHAPQVLLLDEPASGLDPEARNELAILFRQLQASGMTLLVSSHILAELEAYSSHMLVLKDGKILEHRALSNGSHGTSSRALQLSLASPNPRLAEILAAHSSVVLSKNSDNHAEFDFSGSSDEQAQLLAELIQSGLAISSFGEQNLQQAYLRTIASKDTK